MLQEELEIVVRVRDHLAYLGQKKGALTQSDVDNYHAQIDQLETIGKDVAEFRIRESDWSPDRVVDRAQPGIWISNTGPLTGNEPLIVSSSTFRKRLVPACRFVDRLYQALQPTNVSSTHSLHQSESNRPIQVQVVGEVNVAITRIGDIGLDDETMKKLEVLAWQFQASKDSKERMETAKTMLSTGADATTSLEGLTKFLSFMSGLAGVIS